MVFIFHSPVGLCGKGVRGLKGHNYEQRNEIEHSNICTVYQDKFPSSETELT